jgi:hypothetical protein
VRLEFDNFSLPSCMVLLFLGVKENVQLKDVA